MKNKEKVSFGTLGDVYGAGYIADCSVMLDMDDFMFSIAFSSRKTKDEVFDKLNEAKMES